MKRFLLTYFFLFILSSNLSACRVVTPQQDAPDTSPTPLPTIQHTPEKDYRIEMRLNELENTNRQLKERINKLERRQKDLERSIAVIADHNNLAIANTASNQTHTSAHNILSQAQHAYQHKQYTHAVTLLNHYLQENTTSPHASDALWFLAHSHSKLNNCESAVRTAYQLIQRYPDNARTPDVFLLIAQCQNRLQQKDTAKGTLRSLMMKYPNSRAAKKAHQLLK